MSGPTTTSLGCGSIVIAAFAGGGVGLFATLGIATLAPDNPNGIWPALLLGIAVAIITMILYLILANLAAIFDALLLQSRSNQTQNVNTADEQDDK